MLQYLLLLLFVHAGNNGRDINDLTPVSDALSNIHLSIKFKGR